MEVKVFDRHFVPLTTFKIADSKVGRFTLDSDTQTYLISDGVLLSTFTASFSKQHEDSQYLTLGNYLAFKDEWGVNRCFVINDIPNETRMTREIYAEDVGLDLLNSSSLIYKPTEEQPIEYYVNRECYNSGWEIGLNEIKTKKKVEFSDNTTVLKRLQDICTAFECEMYFEIEFGARGLKRQKINIVKHVGLDKPKLRLTNGRELRSMSKQVSIKEMRNAVYVTGANGTDIADISYSDGRYYSNYSSNLIYDLEMSQEWNRFSNLGKNVDNAYYEFTYQSEKTNPYDILNDGIKALQEKNKVQATYNAEISFKVGEEISVGDMVQLVDPEFNPALFLEARVNQITVSRTNPSSNQIEISNAKEIDDGISSRIKSLKDHQNTLEEININNISWDMEQTFQGDKVILTAHYYRAGREITSEFKGGSFSWEKIDINGEKDEEFSQKYFGVGNTITVDLNTVDRTDRFTCTLLVYPFQLVSFSYFQNGLTEIATKIEKERADDSSVILFATDLHQAESSWIRSNANIYRHANEHIKNMVELTRMTDVDLMVLGGDLADGSMSKTQQVRQLKKVMSTAGLAKCPIMACKGNHDDNTWYSYHSSINGWDFQSSILPKEMTQLLIDPIRHYKGTHVTEFNTAYIDIKGVRHIILNSTDAPYTYGADGNPQFYGLEIRATSSKQLKWLADVLKSTPDDYKVALYRHIDFGTSYSKSNYSSYNEEQLMQLLNAFQNHKNVRIYNDDPNFSVDFNVDFTSKKSAIIYGLYGHRHNDKISKVNNIDFISTGCSCPIPRHQDGTGLLDDRELQTLKEDLFDVLVYTPSKKRIKIFRYGAGKDREIKL